MIQWKEQSISVSKLKPFERNPRKISKEQLDKLEASIKDVGYHKRIIVTQDFRVIGGHQRIKILKKLGIKEIPVLVPQKKLTDAQFKKILIQDNLSFGEFDFDIIYQDFTVPQLLDFGMKPNNFKLGDNEKFDPKDEWKQMPAYEQINKMAFRTVYVHFKTQDDVDAFAKLTGQKLTAKTKSIWFPEEEREIVADKVYAAKTPAKKKVAKK